MKTETQTTFCRICEAACGLLVTTAEGNIVEVQPDPDHVTSQIMISPNNDPDTLDSWTDEKARQ